MLQRHDYCFRDRETSGTKRPLDGREEIRATTIAGPDFVTGMASLIALQNPAPLTHVGRRNESLFILLGHLPAAIFRRERGHESSFASRLF